MCKCDCGIISSKLYTHLIKGKYKYCSQHCKLRQQQDITGQRFSHLVAVERTKEKYISPKGRCEELWLLKCDCGKTKIARVSDLKSGRIKSCGCARNESVNRRDILGQEFNFLTPIELIGQKLVKDGDGYRKKLLYKCQCKCGTICEVIGEYIISGHIKSCGCVRQSYGEAFINNELKKLNIKFKREFSCIPLKTNIKGCPRFDFAILNNDNSVKCFIEYQGQQHYEPKIINNIDFGKQQREITDPLKRNYCKEHNIPLYEIRYDEDIEQALNRILTEQKII